MKDIINLYSIPIESSDGCNHCWSTEKVESEQPAFEMNPKKLCHPTTSHHILAPGIDGSL